MKFIADDGKIFDTMEECEEYEKVQGEGKEIALLWESCITVYNRKGDIQKITTDITEPAKCLREIAELVNSDKCWFMDIHCTNTLLKVCDYMYDEYGIFIPRGTGLWRYDNEDECWINFNDEIEELKTNWGPFNIRL